MDFWALTRRIAWLRGLMTAIAMSLLATAAPADEKPLKGVALVVGQSGYEHLSPLPNPENDAEAIDGLLSDLGFEVDLVRDADQKKLARSLERFVEDAEGADVALLYYSGHGIEAGGENFILPIDADDSALENAGEELVALSKILAELQAKVPVTIVLLDACRSNPFPPGATIKLAVDGAPVTIGAAGLGAPRGAISLGDPKPDAGLGAVLGFAAAPGQAALDGEPGANSPYAAALLKHLSAGGYAFADVMTMVTEEVYLKTDARQTPWTNTSLRKLLYFGEAAEDATTDDAAIRGERRKLLLTMASVPDIERRQVATVAKDSGVPMDALFAMLKAVGAETPDDPDQLARLLNDQAARLKSLLVERETLSNADPEIARLASLANEAVREGALETAITFHERAKSRIAELESTLDDAEADLKARRIENAAVFADSADTYSLAFNYAHASEDFGKAFEQVERWDDTLALKYKLSEARALSDLGYFRADAAALERAQAAYAIAAKLAPADTNPDGWADAQSGLAMTIWVRGERQAGPEGIEEAAEILRAAIASDTLKANPDKRAQLQGDLALVLMTLGERQSGWETLEESVAAARAAMTVRTRAVAPMEWARLQNHLGSTLFVLGSRQQSRERLEEGVAAFRAALEVWTPANDPMGWANAQNNLALSLGELGARDADSARLTEAAALLDAIFEVRTREYAPLHWAETHSNRGATVYHIGLRENDLKWFEEAVKSFNFALEEITRERDPLKWAGIEDNLGMAYSAMAERTGETASLDLAIAAYQNALSERTRERVPLEWGSSQNNLANAFYKYGELTGDTKRFGDAIKIFEEILDVRTRDKNPIAWANTHNNLANAHFSMGQHRAGPDSLRKAEKHYRLALEAHDKAANPVSYADTHYNIALLLLELGKQTSDRDVLARAKVSLDECRNVYHAAGQRQYDSFFDNIQVGIELADLDLVVKDKLEKAKQEEAAGKAKAE
ncbi:MAG TPA: caspase family protein [Rhizobiaceae bacterium]|nr:caspase family protein [Rhizobiaceae bacterium]